MKKIIVARLLAIVIAFLALALTACDSNGNNRNQIPITIKGKVVSLEERELYYQDNRGFGSGKMIAVPLTFLQIEDTDRQMKAYLLVGPHNLQSGDVIRFAYMADNEITGWEIWRNYYPGRGAYNINAPNVKFKVDGYVVAWEKVR